MIRFLTLCIFFVVISCNDQLSKSDVIIEENEMSDVMRDIILAETYVQSYLSKDTTLNKDSLLRSQIELVLTLHKTDAQTFSTSYRYYMNHPDLFKIVIDSASNRFTKDREALLHKFE